MSTNRPPRLPLPPGEGRGEGLATSTPAIQVDSHHHVWRLARGDYAWLHPTSPLHRDYDLADLRPQLGPVTATVLVQAAPTEAETAFLLDTAAHSDGLVRAVVGWADLRDPAAVERAAQAPLLRGLRPMLQDIPDTDWILHPTIQPGLQTMTRSGLRLDALVQPRHLPTLLRLADRHPDLPVVIDHAAKPAIARNEWQPWATNIARLARETPWCCKLSGLITEAAPGWTAETLRPWVDHLLECFGPNRLMWGSDWPVLDLAGGYTAWRTATAALLPPKTHPAILGGTAKRFYALDLT